VIVLMYTHRAIDISHARTTHSTSAAQAARRKERSRDFSGCDARRYSLSLVRTEAVVQGTVAAFFLSASCVQKPGKRRCRSLMDELQHM